MYLGLKKLWREEGRKSRGVCERRKGKKGGAGRVDGRFFFFFAPPAPLSLSPSLPPSHHHARVSPVLGEEAQVQGQVEVGEGLVDEAGVAGLIPGEERENFGDGRVGRLQAAGELLVQEEARKFGGAGALQEFEEDLAGGALDGVGRLLEGLVADKVGLECGGEKGRGGVGER